jgi:hypothetical protein
MPLPKSARIKPYSRVFEVCGWRATRSPLIGDRGERASTPDRSERRIVLEVVRVCFYNHKQSLSECLIILRIYRDLHRTDK